MQKKIRHPGVGNAPTYQAAQTIVGGGKLEGLKRLKMAQNISK
jgi:hypothetical protein